MRNTSIQAYNHIKEDGLLSKMRMRVYETLYLHGPLTGRELNFRMAVPGEASASFHKRLSELEDLGVVETVGTRPATQDTEAAILWDATDRLPQKPVRPIPLKDRIVQVRKMLMELKVTIEANDGHMLNDAVIRTCIDNMVKRLDGHPL